MQAELQQVAVVTSRASEEADAQTADLGAQLLQARAEIEGMNGRSNSREEDQRGERTRELSQSFRETEKLRGELEVASSKQFILEKQLVQAQLKIKELSTDGGSSDSMMIAVMEAGMISAEAETEQLRHKLEQSEAEAEQLRQRLEQAQEKLRDTAVHCLHVDGKTVTKGEVRKVQKELVAAKVRIKELEARRAGESEADALLDQLEGAQSRIQELALISASKDALELQMQKLNSQLGDANATIDSQLELLTMHAQAASHADTRVPEVLAKLDLAQQRVAELEGFFSQHTEMAGNSEQLQVPARVPEMDEILDQPANMTSRGASPQVFDGKRLQEQLCKQLEEAELKIHSRMEELKRRSPASSPTT